MTAGFRVRSAIWREDREVIRRIRLQVFILEQSVPEEIEWDGRDAACHHVLAESSNRDAVGTARLQGSGKIGRMAVVRPWRGQGVGSAMLASLLEAARQRGIDEVFLHAQTPVLGFYEQAGFRAEGEEFMEAGIPHRLMRRRTGID